MKAVKIEKWSVVPTLRGPYDAPELAVPVLRGYVREHPTLGEGWVKTSYITDAFNQGFRRYVRTKSGTVYELGGIDPKYREWLKKHRPDWDWRHPITIKDKDKEEHDV